MFLSDTEKSTSSNTKTEWSLNNQGLTNNLTETTYEIDNLSYSLKKDGYKGVASIFYNNNFLCNLTTLYSQVSIYKKHGIKESTIVSQSEEKLSDLEGGDLFLSNTSLRFKSKEYGIAGLRAIENNISFEVLFYGKHLTTVSKEIAHKIETNKNIYLKEKLSSFNEKLKNKQTTSESDKIRNSFASKNYKIIRSPKEVMLTTETNINLKVLKRLDVITAECAYGMNIFKDLFASISDIFGGRNKSIQNTLKDARKNVLAELQKEAFSLGANAVIGIDLDYSEISGGGKFGMLFIVASGTAVIVES
ncbi:YbjQ family protein [Pseudoalteromonas sp. A601]|uniref:YbjQ family protein n=1 Tax=Pseudoalteromonas sp. A601 TaxID=1967839 RepID=UPI001594C707|nr:YbjQ family protein [Pseudoalteromonas sp. A601]